MNQKELKELIELLVEKEIAEFELERGDLKVRIKRSADPVPAQAAPHTITVLPGAGGSHVGQVAHAVPAEPAMTSPAAVTAAAGQVEEAGIHVVKSPIVGTFYESPSPGSPPFVKIGDSIEAGAILCIVEAMKLMNEIESDVSGEIVKKLVSNGQPVEYGQPLFAVRPK